MAKTNFPKRFAVKAPQRARISPPNLDQATNSGFTTSPLTTVRLSDPQMRKAMASTVKLMTNDRAAALRFLQEVGIATPTGRLSKRYGG